MMRLKLKYYRIAIILLLVMSSCVSTKTAFFDPYSYKRSLELKLEATRLINKAVTPYANSKEDVEVLLCHINQLIDYEKHKSYNGTSYSLWKELTGDEKKLLTGFFTYWKTKDRLSPVFVEEAKKQLLEAFDLLLEYELKKDQTSKDALLDLISK